MSTGKIGPIPAPPSILVVDDEPGMLRYMRTILEVDAYNVETASSGTDAVQRIQKGPTPDLVLLDLVMPGIDGLQTLEQLRQIDPKLKVVMLSCVSDTKKVVQAMHLGAQDYLTKPFQKSELDALLKQFLDRSPEVAPPPEGEVDEVSEDVFFVAGSPAMHKIRSQAKLVSNVDIPVLILGDSGTGKEVVARLIHKMSARAHRTFLKVNCAAVPAELLESELFGYEAGAFTGAVRSKPGKFELCNKGTLLLDEIGEMPPALQAKLLHVLQDGEFARLGGRASIKVDVRVLAATNINMEEAIATKLFRADLYYRLNAFTLKVPALRERKEEIPLLLKHFMSLLSDRYARHPLPLSPALVDACIRYPWPGNLRELENFIKRYLILRDDNLAMQELQSHMETAASAEPAKKADATANGLKSLVRGVKDEAEIEAISKALEQTNWNRKHAAALLRISYKALLYKMRQYGIEDSRPRARNANTWAQA